MNDQELENIRSRCEAKLRFAKLYLGELRSIEVYVGNDIERAHSESFLYHLLGARDAFLHEINRYYKANLNENSVSPGKLRDSLAVIGVNSKELVELYNLENDHNSWLYLAKNMRDISTHVSGVKRHFHSGGPHHGKVFLHHPITGISATENYPEEFERWYIKMEELLSSLRESALLKNKLKI
jgi:hypothetical protein